jgi:riboflavin kinase/FMN adenylyltransferase
MRILYDLNGLQEAKSLGLGFFDGVHLAHRKIIEKTVSLARENGVKSAIITFEKSPSEVFESASRCGYDGRDERSA